MTATAGTSAVRVVAADGSEIELSARALRDACACAKCRHPSSGQRLFETAEVVRGVRPVDVRQEDGAVIVSWDDGHASTFPLSWIAEEHAAAVSGARPRLRPSPWRRGDFELGWVQWADLTDSPPVERQWLATVVTRGFGLLRGVPLEDGTVATVAERFGPVHETNYGRVFDVSVRLDATNLADTAMPLSVHTDNPYRRPQPTLQLLHCLASSATGGETVLVDGLLAAERLRVDDPEAFRLLAELPVRFSYRDHGAVLVNDAPVIDVSPTGQVLALRVNNRSKGVPAGAAVTVDAWYEAYFTLLDRLADPLARLSFRLEPGDVVVFDNERVLHGRTGFSGAGYRRLQGCYAFRDALASRLALLDEAGLLEEAAR